MVMNHRRDGGSDHFLAAFDDEIRIENVCQNGSKRAGHAGLQLL